MFVENDLTHILVAFYLPTQWRVADIASIPHLNQGIEVTRVGWVKLSTCFGKTRGQNFHKLQCVLLQTL